MVIRKASPADWPAIRRLCCKTGRDGNPIEEERWPFFAEHWIGPYQSLLPEWTFVAECEATRDVMGYVAGCPDSRSFARSKWIRFHPRLVAGVILRAYSRNADTRRYVRRLLALERCPERCLSMPTRRALLSKYPAHLHINLDERCRGRGIGGRLLARYFEALAAKGIAGAHVLCGEGPERFYREQGFIELEKVRFNGSSVYAMGRPLAAGRSFPDGECRLTGF